VTVTIGVFDGIHLGHREILKKCNKNDIIFSFTNETMSTKNDFLYSTEQKIRLLKEMGFKNIYYVDFSKIRNVEAYTFVNRILQKELGATRVIVGEGFRFGKNAEGDVTTLIETGLTVDVIKKVRLDGEIVSSTRIRELIKNGEMIEAERLLGDKYTIDSKVVKGNQIGRTINFPSINQNFEKEQLIPKRGVYLSQTYIDGQVYHSLTNIGLRPTVTKDTIPIAETNIFDFNSDIYGKIVKVKLCSFIRGERKFRDLNNLKEAINRDKHYSNSLANIMV
jgi:riboflavin kinase/FMN adenylyltransferase